MSKLNAILKRINKLRINFAFVIPKETVELIHQTAVIEDVIGDYVELKKNGSNYRGLSPFTNEKTPSFYVVPSKGIFKCFSSGKGGSLATFLMEHEKVSYPEALRIMARRYNIEIQEREQTPEELAAVTEKESLAAVTSWAQKWLTDQLQNTPEGKAIGLSYFKNRGFRNDILEKFLIGFCPEGWEVMTNAALDAGYTKERLIATGLSKAKQSDGKLFDFFHGRVMFPIRDVTGKVIGFGGRTLKTEKKIAKYFNSSDSLLYDKSNALYGVYLAKPHILKEDMCFLVEGYTDVMAMHQSGVENVVSSSGTALTKGQIHIIRRITKNVTVLFDGDRAGMAAALRGIDILLKEGMNVKVVTFPDGDDPDSYSKKVSSEEFQKYIREDALDFLAFKSDFLSTDAGDDPLKRAELIHSIVETIACVPDAIQRSVYVQTTAARLKLPEELLQGEVAKELQKRLKLEARKTSFKSKSSSEGYRGSEGYYEQTGPPPSAPLPGFENVPTEISEDLAPGIPARNRTDRDILEDNLIRLLMEHGEEMVSVEIEIEMGSEGDTDNDDEGVFTEVPFAELLVHRIETYSLALESESSNFIFEKYKKSLDEYVLPSTDSFFEETTPEVQSRAANLLVNKYSLSENWEHKHEIFVIREADILEKALSSATTRLMLFDVQKNIDTVIRALARKGVTDEEVTRLLREKINLDRMAVDLNASLGVVILPK
ncbi:MAG: DNA primase [Bacteroidetes bacterium]|nr:MAG: DNA primase [Bacteroidota bacterium]